MVVQVLLWIRKQLRAGGFLGDEGFVKRSLGIHKIIVVVHGWSTTIQIREQICISALCIQHSLFISPNYFVGMFRNYKIERLRVSGAGEICVCLLIILLSVSSNKVPSTLLPLCLSLCRSLLSFLSSLLSLSFAVTAKL